MLVVWVPYTSLARLAPDCQIEKAAYFQSGAIRSSRQDIRFPSISSLAKSGWPSFWGRVSFAEKQFEIRLTGEQLPD